MNINLSSVVATTQLQPIDSEENTWQVYRITDTCMYLRADNGDKIRAEMDIESIKLIRDDVRSGYKHGDKLTIDFTIGE